MKQRLLVFFDQIRVPQTVTGENGRLIGFTRPFPDRADQCCLEVTCAEWAELQRYRWASSVLENGYLIPDVDFVAKDGAVFQDAAECVAHERALDVPAWKRALEDKRSGVPADLCGNHERVGWLEIDLIKIGSEETLLAILNGYDFPVTGFRARMPGVAGSHRSATEIPVIQAYTLAIPEDSFTLSA